MMTASEERDQQESDPPKDTDRNESLTKEESNHQENISSKENNESNLQNSKPTASMPALESALAKARVSSKPDEQKSNNDANDIQTISVGEPGVRSKLRFDVVTAKVIETAGKKHVSYTIMMKRVNNSSEVHSVMIERRYSDFCYVYECILRNFHPSVLGDFIFPKKVLIGNFKAEVIAERTEAFHKFLNLIANCDNLLYSDYFYSFLSSEEYNEAISHIKLYRYDEAIPLLENIFYIREKLLTIGNIHVLQCLCELIATLSTVKRYHLAYSYVLVATKSFDLVKGHPDAESLKVPFLKLAAELAKNIGQNSKPYEKQLSELRYKGVKLENAKSLLEVIRERYIHRTSNTAKIA